MSPIAITAIVMGGILLLGSLFIAMFFGAISWLDSLGDGPTAADEDRSVCGRELGSLRFQLDSVSEFDRETQDNFARALELIARDYRLVPIDELSSGCLRAAVAYEEVYLHHQATQELWEECDATATCDLAAWEADELPGRWAEADRLLDEADRLLGDVAD